MSESIPDPTRRQFLRQTGTLAAAGAAGLSLPPTAPAAGPAPGDAVAPPATNPSGKLVVGIIGPGGQGTGLLQSFASMPDVTIAWVCDVDAGRREQAAGKVEQRTGSRPKADGDLRRVLDDKGVDAVVIATPDHWHAPATILACAAGKHVYVEKPASHNVREGRLMIEAARRHKRVVQVGTQSRSTSHVMRAMRLLREGAIGDVLVAKAWNSQLRRSIGKAQPTEPPEALDYDAWVGPAPLVPYQKNLLHGNWRWWHAFGTGDMGNDGVHDIDIARWGLGVDEHPSSVAAMGGKYFFDDDQQFPDTMTVAFEYPGAGPAGRPKQLVFEQRLWSPYTQEGYENGNAFYGTKGVLLLGKHEGWKLFRERNKLAEEMRGTVENTPHHRNFIDCIRSGGTPNADIEVGHLSSSLAHLGNIAVRAGRRLKFDPKTEQIVSDDEANRLVGGTYRPGHWAVPQGI